MSRTSSNWRGIPGKQPYSVSSREGSRAFFSLMLAWAAGIVVFYAAGAALGLIPESAATPERLSHFAWRLALIYLPNAVCAFLAVLTSARVHREPHRESRVLHVVAGCGVPVLAMMRTILSEWDILQLEGICMMAACVALGGLCGMLVDRLWEAGQGRSGHLWGDSGATAAEYLGTVVVVVAIVAGITATGLGGELADRLRVEICRLTGGNCSAHSGAESGAKQTDEDFEPALCNTRNVSGTAGHEVKLLWFKLGNEYAFQKSDFVKQVKDGNGNPKSVHKYRITFSQAGKLSGAWSPKFGLKAGELDDSPAEVELEGGIKLTNGDTFEFDNEKARDDFLEKLDQRASAKAQMQYGRDFASIQGAKRYMDLDKEINKTVDGKKISYGTVALEGTANASFALNDKENAAIAAKLGGKVKAAPGVTITRDSINGLEGSTYTFELEGGLNLEGKKNGAATKPEGSGKRTATVTVNRDVHSPHKLKSIIITHTSQFKGSVKNSVEGSKEGTTEDENGKKTKGKIGGSSTKDRTYTKTITNSLKFDDAEPGVDSDRKVAEDWLKNNKTAAFTSLFSDDAPTEAPKNGGDFDRLMFDKGQSSLTQYKGVGDAAEFGFELNLAVADVGYKASFSKDVQQLGEAKFLGAPHDGKRGYVPFGLCAK
ncbi:hypothetical protein ACWCP6_05320 [Streptomyces sp. NPDC002004]